MTNRFVLVLLLALLATACGGGSGGNVVDGARGERFLNSSFVAFGATSASGAELTVHFGAGSTDEVANQAKPGIGASVLTSGGMLFDLNFNQNGVFGNEDHIATYQVDDEGSVVISAQSVLPDGRGGLDPADEFVLFARGRAGKGTQLFLFGRRFPAAAESELAGGFHVLAMDIDPLTAATAVTVNRATLDGVGMITMIPGTINAQGAISTFAPADEPYKSSGNLVLDEPGRDLRGIVDESRSILLLGGSDANNSSPHLRIMIRESQAAAIQTLAGSYHVGAIGNVGTNYESAIGTVTFDGQGTGQFALDVTNGSDESTTDTKDLTYAVAPDGTVMVTLESNEQLLGAVSTDGRLASLVTTSAGSPPTFVVLLRK